MMIGRTPFNEQHEPNLDGEHIPLEPRLRILMNGIAKSELLPTPRRPKNRIVVVPWIEIRKTIGGVQGPVLVQHIIGYGRIRSLHQGTFTVVVAHAVVQVDVARGVDKQ